MEEVNRGNSSNVPFHEKFATRVTDGACVEPKFSMSFTFRLLLSFSFDLDSSIDFFKSMNLGLLRLTRKHNVKTVWVGVPGSWALYRFNALKVCKNFYILLDINFFPAQCLNDFPSKKLCGYSPSPYFFGSFFNPNVCEVILSFSITLHAFLLLIFFLDPTRWYARNKSNSTERQKLLFKFGSKKRFCRSYWNEYTVVWALLTCNGERM